MSSAQLATHLESDTEVTQWLGEADAGQIRLGHSFSATCEKKLNAHEHLFLAGEPQRQIYHILEGVIGIYKLLADGRRQIVTFCYPGDLIGIDHSRTFTQSAEALCTSRVRGIPVKAIDKLIMTEPGFGQAMLNVLSTELAETRDQLLSLGRKSATEKVATFLLRIARRNEREHIAAHQLHLPMTRAEIADYLGLTIETVSRNITRLKVIGVIQLLSTSQVLIKDMDKLEAIAEGEGS